METSVAVRKAQAVENRFRNATRAPVKPVARRARTKDVALQDTLATTLGVFGRVHRLRLLCCQSRL